jgi:hypothetical protein
MGNPQRPDTNGTTTRALGIFVLSVRQKTLRLPRLSHIPTTSALIRSEQVAIG